MALARLSPWASLPSVQDMMSHLFDEGYFPQELESMTRRWFFPLDLYETETDYVIEAALPGIAPDEVHLTATEHLLTIRAAQRQEERSKEKGKYLRKERYEGAITRTVGFPSPIVPGSVTAAYEGGILTIEAPKAKDAKVEQIPITVK